MLFNVYVITIYNLLKYLPSGQGEEEIETFDKITSILLKLELHSQCIPWLNKELNLAKQCQLPSDDLAG